MRYTELVSIAIPTYKRPELLKKCIEAVILAVKKYEIRVYVYDDSVSLINDDVYFWAKSQYSLFYIVRNQKNLGIDNNISKCVENSESEYIWLLGEDDLLVSDAIDCVLPVLCVKKYPFVFSNYSYISNDYKNILRQKRLSFDIDTEINGTNFFEKYIWAAGFIGACIIRRSDWLSVNQEKYKGTYFNHVGVISEIICNNTVMVISKPLVLNRAENIASTSWSKYSFDVVFGWDRMLKSLYDIYPDKSVNLAIEYSKEIFWHRSVLFFLSKKADGIYNYKAWVSHVLKGDFSLIFKFYTLFILILPCAPLSYIKRIVGKINL